MRIQFQHRLLELLLAAVVWIVISGQAQGQQVTMKVVADTTTISIGEQFRLELEATYPATVRLYWPAVPDTFHGFEVISRTGIDTVKNADGTLLRKQELILTSFDSGFHVIPPFKALYMGAGSADTLFAESDPMLITVQTLAVDTTKAIRDIKDLVRYPYTWKDALPWVFGALVLGLIGWLVYYFLKNRKQAPQAVVQAPAIPPHERALEELRRIDAEKIWQQGNFKLYHTRVTDVLRTYLAETRQVNAPEMTTNEIISLNIINSLPINQFNSIKQILELADLVKFAKVHPLPADNEQAMRLAVSFIAEDGGTINSSTITVS